MMVMTLLINIAFDQFRKILNGYIVVSGSFLAPIPGSLFAHKAH